MEGERVTNEEYFERKETLSLSFYKTKYGLFFLDPPKKKKKELVVVQNEHKSKAQSGDDSCSLWASGKYRFDVTEAKRALVFGVGADGGHGGCPCSDARTCSWKLPSTHLLIRVPFVLHTHTLTKAASHTGVLCWNEETRLHQLARCHVVLLHICFAFLLWVWVSAVKEWYQRAAFLF